MEKDFELAAVIRTRVSNYGDYGNATITFVRRMNEDGTFRHFYYGDFDDLEISCQWNAKEDSVGSKRGVPYAITVAYDGGTSLSNYKVRAALLNKVEKGLEREYKKNGDAETFGEFALRVFRILGVEVLVEPDHRASLGDGAGRLFQPQEIKNVFNRHLMDTLEGRRK